MFQAVLTTAEWLNVQPLIDYISDLKVRYSQYQQYRHTLKELSSLSDRELRDIGINRSMIKSIAMEVYYDNLKGRV